MRAWMIKADFPDSEVCGHFGTVIYNGALIPPLIHQKPAAKDAEATYALISSVREFHRYYFEHKAKMVRELIREAGNLPAIAPLPH